MRAYPAMENRSINFVSSFLCLVIQIGYENEHILSKVLTKYINEKKEESKTEMYSLLILMELPEYHDIYNPKILDCLSSFYGLNKNKAIICKENPNSF